MKTKIPEEPFYAVAEIADETIRGNEKECDMCSNRFRCWTNSKLVVLIDEFTVSRDVMGRFDRFDFTTQTLPNCFRCTNLAGKDVTIQSSKGVFMHGTVITMTVEAVEDSMRMKISGVSTTGASWI